MVYLAIFYHNDIMIHYHSDTEQRKFTWIQNFDMGDNIEIMWITNQ